MIHIIIYHYSLEIFILASIIMKIFSIS